MDRMSKDLCKSIRCTIFLSYSTYKCNEIAYSMIKRRLFISLPFLPLLFFYSNSRGIYSG